MRTPPPKGAPGAAAQPTPNSPFWRRYAPELAVLLLTIWLVVNMVTAIWRKSLTVDALVTIPAGYYALTTRDFSLLSEHPPLPKMLSALPFLFMEVKRPPRMPDSYATLYEFWKPNRARFVELGRWGQIPMVALTVALAWLIFRFASQLFNKRAGVFAVAIMVFEPSVLAHGRIAQTDLAGAFGYTLWTFSLYHYWRKPSATRAALVGLATTLALLTKFSLLIVFPLLLIGLLAGLLKPNLIAVPRRPLLTHTAVAVLLGLVAVNACYFFQRPDFQPFDLGWIRGKAPDQAPIVVPAMQFLSHVLPLNLLTGIYHVYLHNRSGHAAFLLGDYSTAGWWYYFPIAFALKTTVPFLCTAAGAVVWSGVRLARRAEARFLFLLVPLAAFAVLVCQARINIGVRYLLPIYPLLFLLAGAWLDAIWRSATAGRRWKRGVVLFLIAAMAWEAMRAYPHYLSYMNQLRGPNEPWELLSDSNVEWGEDIQGLAEFLRARGETRVQVAAAAGLTLPLYNIHVAEPGTNDPNFRRAKYTAIGTSYLNGSVVPKKAGGIHAYRAYRARRPTEIVGNSIYVYAED